MAGIFPRPQCVNPLIWGDALFVTYMQSRYAIFNFSSEFTKTKDWTDTPR